jgi:hypothetical protein
MSPVTLSVEILRKLGGKLRSSVSSAAYPLALMSPVRLLGKYGTMLEQPDEMKVRLLSWDRAINPVCGQADVAQPQSRYLSDLGKSGGPAWWI